MRRFLSSLLLAVTAVLPTSAVVAHAADWCFDVDGLIVVFQNFSKPGKGNCKVVLGHVDSGNLVTGTACLTSDGTTLRVGYSKHGGASDSEIGEVILPNPALTGGTSSYLGLTSGGITSGDGPASAAICDPGNQPVP